MQSTSVTVGTLQEDTETEGTIKPKIPKCDISTVSAIRLTAEATKCGKGMGVLLLRIENSHL